jgi:hypothetical protein
VELTDVSTDLDVCAETIRDEGAALFASFAEMGPSLSSVRLRG